MNVKHKQSGVVLEVFASQGCYWLLGNSLLAKHEWELIEDKPPEKGEDVTEVCEVFECWLRHGKEEVVRTWGPYRLVKEQFNRYASDQTAVFDPCWAFRVEKKV